MRLILNKLKAAQAAAHLVKLHNGPLDTIVLLKLLYLADRKSLIESGYPITGDGMVSMPRGPVLSTIYDWIQYGFDQANPWYAYLTERDNHKIALQHDNPDVGELSEYELNVLKYVHNKHGHLGPWDISKLTHELPEYEDPHGSSFPIDPNTILRAEGKSDPEIERINHSAEEAYQFDRFLRRCANAAS
jgi:uncharacterized phage-associated protein